MAKTKFEGKVEEIFKTNRFEEIQQLFNNGVMNNLENDRLKKLMENRDFNFIDKLLKSLINHQQHFLSFLYDFADKVAQIETKSLRIQCEEILINGDVEEKLYFVSIILLSFKEEDLLYLFDNSGFDLFEIIINMSKFINDNREKLTDICGNAESLECLFTNLSFKVKEIIKKKVIIYFQKEDFEALTLMVNVGLLDYFTIDEYVSLIEDSNCDIIKILILSLSVPYWQILDTRGTIFEIFEKIKNFDININKKLKNKIFRLFKEESKWILIELIMDQFFDYLEKKHIEILFQEPSSKLKTNFNEILIVENKEKEFGFSDYIERIAGFLIKINAELGKTFLFDIINNLPNESNLMLEKDLKGWIDYPAGNLNDLIESLI
ncbi:hypothetical protein LCGC14_1553780 [marine sediment metagenome]|uniref:Uncharacterized protein n=1 Tax=marine sediment metagenome TaxID=412755 RepID=A0A0F9IPK9_9ZZZZ